MKPAVTLLPFLLLHSACKETAVSMPSPDEIREQRFGDHGDFLREAERLEIYSVESTAQSILPSEPPIEFEFHGFKIYGKTQTSIPSEIEAVWAELYGRIYSEPGDLYTYCFWPRHGIRAYRHEEKRDYLVCFECNHLYVYADPTSDDFVRIGLETLGDELTLDKILDEANVPRELPQNYSEQGGTGQPATRPESKSEGSDKPQPESEGRSR
jgi:hypothetical protein